MNVAGVILSIGPEPRIPGGDPRRHPRTQVLANAALKAGLAEVIVVVDEPGRADQVPDRATVLLDEGESQASALRAAVDWCTREGYEAIVLATLGVPLPGGDVAATSEAWRALATSSLGSLVVATHTDRHAGIFRIEDNIWPMLPLDGLVVAALDSRIELLRELPLATQQEQPKTTDDVSQGSALVTLVPHTAVEEASPEDIKRVRELLGRSPSGAFSVVVRNRAGDPIVIRNAPFLDDNTPMPTRYWLVGQKEQEAVGRLESSGGVRQLEALIDPKLVAETHDRYAHERDALIDPSYLGPRPSGGVGGTRRGVKCLHAHLAWYLAGGGDPIGRHVAHSLAGEISGPVGAIDCGTNSTRLLVLDRDGSVLAREMIITRLGEGVDTNHELKSEAIKRTLEALRRFRRVLDRFGVVRVRATTTSAARDARNREDLFAKAKSVLGFDLELLEGEEEGRLSYQGATSEIVHDQGPVLVVDVGGGSTEFAAGSGDDSSELAGVASLNIGCVRVTERFFGSDPPSRLEIDEARTAISTMLESLKRDQPALFESKMVVGVAGTVATLATLSQALTDYDGRKTNGTTISRAFVDEQLRVLSTKTAQERRQIPGIEPARADVIVGGVLVVQQLLEYFGFDELVYSEHDILDGLAASLL